MNIEVLLKDFREILKHEERALSFYEHYIDQVEDPGIKDQLVCIRNDEIAHVKIAKKLIEYVS